MRASLITIGLMALGLACGDDAGTPASADAALADDGGLCRQFESTVCESGDSVWVDSCGNLGEISEECSAGTVCDDARGLCCSSQGTSDLFGGQPWTTTLDTTHAGAGTEATWALRFETVDYDPDSRGQLLFWRLPVDGGFSRFGFATHIYDPMAADYAAFGIYWIAEGVDDLADSVAANGATENLGSLGATIRLSLPRTDYQTIGLRFVREEADGDRDWFALYATIDSDAELLVGRARFPRTAPAARATLAGTSQVVMQVGKVEPASFSILDLSAFRVSSDLPALNGVPATSGSVRYGTVSTPPFVASEMRYDQVESRLHFSHGQGTVRCQGAGPLF